jgi:hypothetical protein
MKAIRDKLDAHQEKTDRPETKESRKQEWFGRNGGHEFGGQSREDGTQSKNHAVRSGASGGLQGTCRSGNWHSAEWATQGPASSCRVPQEANGTDPRRLWIPEKIGCRL